MNTLDDEILNAGDAYSPVDAWTLDELDQTADLGSLRAAGMGGDDRDG